MGKTADLAMIQKTNIDALHKEGKSQKVITERCGCLQSAVSKHIKCKVDWKEDLGRKRCTSNRDDCKLENTVKQSWFKHLGELHKECTEAGVSASRVTTLRRLQEKGYQATSEPETTSEASYLGCGEKELDCCSVVQSPLFRLKSIFISRSQSLEEEWRGTESMLLEVQCEVSTVSDDLLVLVHCVFWSPQSTHPSTRKF